MARLFIGFKIEDSDAHHLISLIKHSEQTLPNSIRWSLDGNFHITSHFMPNCDEKYIPDLESAMHDVLGKKHHNTILVDTIGLFPQYKSTLCAAFVSPHRLIMNVHNQLKMHLERLSIPVESRQYIPHITLARGFAKNGSFETISANYNIQLNALILYESHLQEGGSKYVPLLTVPVI